MNKFTRINSSLFEWNPAGKKSENQISLDKFNKELIRLRKVLAAEGFLSTDRRQVSSSWISQRNN